HNLDPVADSAGYGGLLFRFLLVWVRYEKGAMSWTSTKRFAEGPIIFAGNDMLTAAMLERLLHHGSGISIWGGRIDYVSSFRPALLVLSCLTSRTKDETSRR
ncbi:ATP-binding protein, partial [Dehalococcoidia bacterium]|nr:ATP-binding protein [Dehalococcoidia bacterium]